MVLCFTVQPATPAPHHLWDRVVVVVRRKRRHPRPGGVAEDLARGFTAKRQRRRNADHDDGRAHLASQGQRLPAFGGFGHDFETVGRVQPRVRPPADDGMVFGEHHGGLCLVHG